MSESTFQPTVTSPPLIDNESDSAASEVSPTEVAGSNPAPEVAQGSSTAEQGKVVEQPTPPKPVTKKIAGLPVLAAGLQPNFVKLLVYGDAGVGKTLLAATSADVDFMDPILFIDVEGGTKTIAHKYSKMDVIRPEDKYNSNSVLVEYGWDTFVKVVESLTGDSHYKTIVVDSLSELYAMCMSKTMEELVKAKSHRDKYVPDKREWGTTSTQMAEQIRKLVHMPKHLICTALRDTRTNSEGVVTAHTPVLAGKLTFRVAGFFNELVYMDTETKGGKVSRRLTSQPVNKYLAKTRDDRLPKTLENPTMPEIVKYVLD